MICNECREYLKLNNYHSANEKIWNSQSLKIDFACNTVLAIHTGVEETTFNPQGTKIIYPNSRGHKKYTLPSVIVCKICTMIPTLAPILLRYSAFSSMKSRTSVSPKFFSASSTASSSLCFDNTKNSL